MNAPSDLDCACVQGWAGLVPISSCSAWWPTDHIHCVHDWTPKQDLIWDLYLLHFQWFHAYPFFFFFLFFLFKSGQPSLSAQKEINVLAGTSLTLSCSYPCKYVRYEKYWCKWKNTGCDSLMSYEQNQTGLIVNCDQDNRILRLNFDQVTTADQGWYWCGLRNAGRYGETVAVYLSVQGGECHICSQGQEANFILAHL